MGVSDRVRLEDADDDADLADQAERMAAERLYDDTEELSDMWVVQVEVVDEDSDDDTDEVEVFTFGPFPPREARSMAHQLGSRLSGVAVDAVPLFPYRTVDEVIGFFLEDDVEEDDDEDVPIGV